MALLSCAAALALAACGGSGGSGDGDEPPPDPLAAYKTQTVNWGSCLKYFSDDGEYTSYLKEIGDRAQCADIRAPLDYDNPDGNHIVVSMLRVKAAASPEAKPSLFFNPGGPGGDGQLDSLVFSRLLSLGSNDSVLGRKYKELSEAYNFVGFSPRGVGASTTVQCAGNELVYETDDTRWGDDSAENIRRIVDHARHTASNCQKNPVSDYIHTDATARDMDLMRHLLGDEKLHYHGTSYGTWLGFWYAGLFPDRVGPMVLDSNMNFSATMHDASIAYDMGVAHTFREYIVPYIARHDNVFHMGDKAESIISDLEAVGREINQAMLGITENFRGDTDDIPEYITTLKAAIEAHKLAEDGKTPDEIGIILTDQTKPPYISSPAFNEVFLEIAPKLVDELNKRAQPGFYSSSKPLFLEAEEAVYQVVKCNDEALQNKDQEFWINKGFELARDVPILSSSIAQQPCIYWDRRTSISKPVIDSLKDAPLLMVQSEYDVPTPLEGAMKTFEQLPAARMVYVNNEGDHGVFLYRTECVDLRVADYLLGKPPAQRLIECQGKPLPFDPPPPQKDTASSTRAGTQPESPFEDPELAERLLEELRKATRR